MTFCNRCYSGMNPSNSVHIYRYYGTTKKDDKIRKNHDHERTDPKKEFLRLLYKVEGRKQRYSDTPSKDNYYRNVWSQQSSIREHHDTEESYPEDDQQSLQNKNSGSGNVGLQSALPENTFGTLMRSKDNEIGKDFEDYNER